MTEQNESWVVTNVSDTYVTVPGQGAVAGKKVAFRTYMGQTSYVDIPNADFNADTIAQMINDQANTLMQVSMLKGDLIAPNEAIFNPATGLYE